MVACTHPLSKSKNALFGVVPGKVLSSCFQDHCFSVSPTSVKEYVLRECSKKMPWRVNSIHFVDLSFETFLGYGLMAMPC